MTGVRAFLWIAAATSVAILTSPETLRSALASAAGALLESTPFLLAGVALARVARGHVTALAGCGCGSGPSARSLPATAATYVAFGPFVAVGRFAAALLFAWLWPRIRRLPAPSRILATESPSLLLELARLLPATLLAAAVMQVSSFVDIRHLHAVAQLLAGTVLGFTASPCGLASVAVAGALRANAPLAATGFLCIAGIADLRALAHMRRPHDHSRPHDALAYAMLALALAVVAMRHGASLVHPLIAMLLGCSSIVCLVLAILHRTQQSGRARVAPALMLTAAIVTAPPPIYHATETTLSDAFPGEHVTFAGALVRDAYGAALVRYAITCCRADATPIVVRLARIPRREPGSWLLADGVLEASGDSLRLVARRLESIPSPADPFVYR